MDALGRTLLHLGGPDLFEKDLVTKCVVGQKSQYSCWLAHHSSGKPPTAQKNPTKLDTVLCRGMGE